MRKGKKMLSILMGAAMLTGVACAKEDKIPATVLPDYEMNEAVLEIDSLQGPAANDHEFAAYKAAGYNMFHLANGNSYVNLRNLSLSNEELNRQMEHVFQLAEKYDLKVTLAMMAANSSEIAHSSVKYYQAKIGETLEKWKDKDTFYGILLTDETVLDIPVDKGDAANAQYMLKKYDTAAEFLRDEYLYFINEYPGKFCETILLGTPGDSNGMPYFVDRTKTFQEYLDYFYDNVMKYIPQKDRVYSHDAYPFTGKADGLIGWPNFVSSLEGIGYAAEETGAKKVVYIQNHRDVINTNMVLYQYYSAMSYGFAHFVTYLYRESWAGQTFSVDCNGNETDNYYHFQAAHKEIRSMEKVFMSFKDNWIGAMAKEGSQRADRPTMFTACTKLLDGYSRIKSYNATQDVLIGIMKDQNGNDGFLVSNQMIPDVNTHNFVEIKFNQADSAAVWINGQGMQTIPLDDGVLRLDLKSGGGAFVIPIKGE